MGFFKNRSDYFKSLASTNKLVAHGVVVDAETRNSFHRFNDEEELVAGCVNFAHFPCVVHFGFSGRYVGDKTSIPKRRHSNALLFLSKVDDAMSMDQIETAYDQAFEVMEQFMSKMYNEWSTLGYCSNFDNLDLSRFNFTPYGPVNATQYGWLLQFDDDNYANNVSQFDASKWF